MSIFKNSGQTKGGSKTITLSHDAFKQACMYVLQNCEEVCSFMEQHAKEIERQSSRRAERRNNDFTVWFRAHEMTGIGRGKGRRGGKGRGCGNVGVLHDNSIATSSFRPNPQNTTISRYGTIE
nr:uncharacterized protein LOC104106583 isoform X2 [Nicotiana tomentosiformis]